MATIFIRRRPDSIMEWTVEDVVDWLKQLKLDKYCKRFQCHLVSGPVLLQMDDILLDDLNITLIEERELLLKESRKLCLQELDIVNQALKHKQKNKDNLLVLDMNPVEGISYDKPRHLSLEEQQTNNNHEQTKSTDNAQVSSDADEVATRATIMVAMLSQENTDLRIQMEGYLQDRYQLQLLREEVAKLQSENTNLVSQVRRCDDENQKLVSGTCELRCDYHKLEETLKQQEVERQAFEDEVETLRRDNRSLRDKYQRLKFKTVEREMSKNASNVFPPGTSSDSRSPKNSPRRNGDTNGKTAGNLQLIEKVYQANKRCAELEDTVRWLSRSLQLENNRNHHQLETQARPPDDSDAPCEPEWPSLTAEKIPQVTILYDEKSTAQDVLQHLTSRGLPTDSDDDIWRAQQGRATDAIVTKQRDMFGKCYRTSNA